MSQNIGDRQADSAPETSYGGVDNLEKMESARDCNNHLASEIVRPAAGECLVLDIGAGTGTFARVMRQ